MQILQITVSTFRYKGAVTFFDNNVYFYIPSPYKFSSYDKITHKLNKWQICPPCPDQAFI